MRPPIHIQKSSWQFQLLSFFIISLLMTQSVQPVYAEDLAPFENPQNNYIAETSSETLNTENGIEENDSESESAYEDEGVLSAAGPQAAMIGTVMRSNNHYSYTSRSEVFQAGSKEVYDIHDQNGDVVTTIIKRISYNVASSMPTIQPLDGPDVSPDGNLIITSGIFSCTRASTGCAPQQKLEVRSLQTGDLLNTITLKLPGIDQVQTARFKEGSSQMIEVTYRSGEIIYYDIATGLPTTKLPAPHNSNYVFNLKQEIDGTQISLYDTRSQQTVIITKSQIRDLIKNLDVDPSGRYAFVNLQQAEGLSGNSNYKVTGNLLIYDIAAAKIVTPAEIIGEIPGRTPLSGVVTSLFYFKDGLMTFNMTSITGTGHGNITSNWSVVLNLDVPGIRYTRVPMTGVVLNTTPVTTATKLILYGSVSGPGNNGIGIYDIASGAMTIKNLPNYGLEKIVGISPDGNYAVVSSGLNAVYFVPVQNNDPVETVLIPLSSAADKVTDFSTVGVSFPAPGMASLKLKNGLTYEYDLQRKILTPAGVNDFYGGQIPANAKVRGIALVRNAAGAIIGWNVVIDLNQNKTGIQNQILSIRKRGSDWAVTQVIDRNYQNTRLYQSIFTYSAAGKLVSIAAFNQYGSLMSRIYNRGSYYEIVTVTGKKLRYNSNLPLSYVLGQSKVYVPPPPPPVSVWGRRYR